MNKKQLLTLLLLLTFGSLFAQTSVNFDNTTDLTTYFNPSSYPIFTNLANSGINNTGSVNVPLGTNDIWTTKSGYSVLVGGVYTMTGDFLIKANSGYGGLGFAVSNTNDPDGFGSPVLGLGMCFHGGGGMMVNNRAITAVAWPPDLVLGNWYRMVLRITCTSVYTFDLYFEIYNLSSTGVLGPLKTAQAFSGINNTEVFAATSIHVYFSAAGSRMEKIDNFTITLSGGAQEVHSPDVTTKEVTAIGTSTATTGGIVTDDHGYPVTFRGVCYSSTNSQPGISGPMTSDGSGTGSYTSNLTGLASNTTYYVRAYAINAVGTNYGETKTFTTTGTPPTPTSITASSTSICDGSSVTLTANGTAGTVNWYTGSCGGTLVGTGNPISLTPSATTTYYANCSNGTQVSAGCASTTITVSPAPSGGSLSGATTSIVYGDATGTISLSGQTGTINNWQKRVNNGTWTNISSTNSTYSETPTSAGTWDYRVVLTSGACSSVYSSIKSITVQPKELTITGTTAANKVYDGGTVATIGGAVVSGMVLGDIITLNNCLMGNFNNSAVGTSKPVTTFMTLAGTNADSYTITQPTLQADITARPLTVSNAAVTSKTYDGNANATITGATLVNAVAGDDVSLSNSTTGTFNNPQIGSNKPVTTTMSLTGTSAGNYTLTQPTLSGTITAKGLTVINAVVTSKQYDGNTNATITGATLSGIVSGDVVTLTNATTGLFNTPAIGSNKPVTTSMTLSGAQSGNYTITQPTLTGNITAKVLTVTGAVVVSKIYDGNTLATITGATLTGVVTGENVILNNATQGNFNNPLVGANKPVSTNMTITGTSIANYTLQQPTLFGEILSNALNVTGIIAANKVYDGTTLTSLSGGTLTGVIPGDVVTVTIPATGNFATPNVGTNIPVTVATPTLSGPDAWKYTVNQPTGITANITSKELVILAIEKQKTYGQVDPQLTHSCTGFIAGEDESDLLTPVIINRAAGENVGQYVIIVSGATSNNYQIIFINNEFIINPKGLTVSTSDASRCYGVVNPQFPLTYSGFVNNENTSVLSTLPTATCVATTTSDPGNYPIIIGGGIAQNYQFIYNNATLTVKELPARPTITQNGHTLHSSASSGNQWYSMNGIIPSATQQDYFVTIEGTYYVIVNQNGCSSEPSESITVMFTGIDQPNEALIKVYPNPATDLVNIETSTNGQVKAELLSQDGKTFLSTEFENKTTIDLSHIPSGLYLIKVTSDYGVKTFKVVVQ
ncbi:MAG: YDG domain-containing protein [Sphingobacteriia bacterium]|nr:YDG domain-containing protein [Sphingobacteriia bacterium]